MGGRVGILLKIFTFVCVVFGIALIVATWFFFMRPLTLDSWFSRFALGAAGLEHKQTQGPDGRLSWFEGGTGDITLVLLHGEGEQAGVIARVVVGPESAGPAPALHQPGRLADRRCGNGCRGGETHPGRGGKVNGNDRRALRLSTADTAGQEGEDHHEEERSYSTHQNRSIRQARLPGKSGTPPSHHGRKRSRPRPTAPAPTDPP